MAKEASPSIATIFRDIESIEAEATTAEQAAFEAYNEAKANADKVRLIARIARGESITPDPPAPVKRKAREGSTAPRGSIQASILEQLADQPEGLSRGNLIHRLGAEGNKNLSASISNALAAMKKSGKLGYSKDGNFGIYVIPA